MMQRIKSQDSFKKLGPQSRRWLEAVGLNSMAEIEQIGVVAAYRRVHAAFPERVTLNLLYGLQSAALGIPWLELPAAMKAALRAEVENNGV